MNSVPVNPTQAPRNGLTLTEKTVGTVSGIAFGVYTVSPISSMLSPLSASVSATGLTAAILRAGFAAAGGILVGTAVTVITSLAINYLAQPDEAQDITR